jgi:hypothetical protein
MATQDFSVTVAGVSVQVFRGDFYDDSTAVYLAAPALFSPLPDGITNHKLASAANPWEG